MLQRDADNTHIGSVKCNGLIHETNLTNNTNSSQLAELKVVISGSLTFVLILPLVLFHFSYFPLGSTAAVLVGAVLSVVLPVLTQDDVYVVLGHKDNLRTIFLLLGMMLIAQYFQRERLVDKLLQKFLNSDINFGCYLFKVSVLSFIFSMFFTNDAACLILTPLVLQVWKGQNRDQLELQSLLLTISTCSNIGSVVTIFGNPLMALIASKTDSPLYEKSLLNLQRSIVYLGPAAVVGCLLNVALLIGHFHIRVYFRARSKQRFALKKEEAPNLGANCGINSHDLNDEPHISNENYELTDLKSRNTYEIVCRDEQLVPMISKHHEKLSIDEDTKPPDKVTQNCIYQKVQAEQRSYHDFKKEDLCQNEKGERFLPMAFSKENKLMNVQDVDIKTGHENGENNILNNGHEVDGEHTVTIKEPFKAANGLDNTEQLAGEQLHGAVIFTDGPGNRTNVGAQEILDDELAPSGSKVFHVILCLSLLMIVCLLLISSTTVKFDVGLVPMCAAVVVIVADAIINRRNSAAIVQKVDWGILLLFFGIFVWMHGFNSTRLPRWLWRRLVPSGGAISTPKQIVVFSCFLLFGTNLFNNIPLTLIVLEQLAPCQNQLPLVLYLGWWASVGGNLTQFGSVSNLIVAQKALSSIGYRFTFFEYLRFGFPTTLIIGGVGTLMIYGLINSQLITMI